MNSTPPHYRDHRHTQVDDEMETAVVETTGNASIEIAASAEHVWGVLTNLSRISELSPECYKAEWKDGSTGPAVGATFHGYNEAGGNKWDVGCEVVAAETAAPSNPPL